MCLVRCFILCLFCYPILSDAKTDKLIVQTKNGQVKGRKDTTVGLNITYYAYQGIPYAEPPTGNLRFEPPTPKKNWNGVFDATRDGNICVQSNPPIGSEDCLNINVYVPEISKNKKLLPTMVWIFGGGFEAGFATYENFGPDYLLEKNVVIVTFNYRLGILGFLSTGDLVVPGNNGLKDQVLALKWVKDNIQNFGGDPNKVTLFGQSAGSASVAYQLQSPLSRGIKMFANPVKFWLGLFHRAIMQSGSSLSLWAFSRRVPEVVKIIADDLKLDTSSSQKIVDGLRKMNYSELQAKAAATVVSQYLSNDPRHGFIFGPVIEPKHSKAFLSEKSHELLRKGDFARVPCIVGFNSLEGTFKFGTLFKLYLLKYDLDNTKLNPIDLNIKDDKKSEAAGHLKKYYFQNHFIAFSDRNLQQFLSDDQFARPMRELVRLLSKHVTVYYYEFSYEGGLWGFANRTDPGVAHSEELGYLWRSQYEPSDLDLVTRRRMTSMWTDFAKVGNPTPDKYFTGEAKWKKSDANFTYLNIGNELVLSQFPEKTSMELWDQIYQKYGNPPYDTF